MTLIESICGLILTIFISFMFSGVLILLIFAYYLRPDKPIKIKHETVMVKKARPEDEYLVVCRTKKLAIYWRRRLLDNIAGCYRRDEIKVINNYGKYICLYFPKTHMIVRFISEKEYFEASTGFHGWVVEQSQVEDWVRAAETKEQ